MKTDSARDGAYCEGWFVTTDKPKLSQCRDSNEGLTMMHVVVLEKCGKRG